MKTNKIVFAGVMGAILMSAGANAADVSVATKGYVDQQVGNVQNTITEANYITMQDVTNAISNGTINLDAYQLTDNMVQVLSEVAAEDAGNKYPSVAAVSAAITEAISGLGFEDGQIEALQGLLGDEGVAAQISALKTDVNQLKTDVAGLTTGDNSVAQQIVNALEPYSTTEESDAAYQAQSTADFQIGTTGGVFRNMTDAEKAALASGITAEKVTAYDALTGDGEGSVADLTSTVTELGTAVTGLETTVGDENSGLVKDVADLNTEIAGKISNPPAACVSESGACVLMINGGAVSWVQVTKPLDDSGTSTTTPEVSE